MAAAGGSKAAQVAAHYDAITHGAASDRIKSEVYHLRQFNNWVKATLFAEFGGKVRLAHVWVPRTRHVGVCAAVTWPRSCAAHAAAAAPMWGCVPATALPARCQRSPVLHRTSTLDAPPVRHAGRVVAAPHGSLRCVSRALARVLPAPAAAARPLMVCPHHRAHRPACRDARVPMASRPCWIWRAAWAAT